MEFQLATTLDPRFKLRCFRAEESSRLKAHLMMLAQAEVSPNQLLTHPVIKIFLYIVKLNSINTNCFGLIVFIQVAQPQPHRQPSSAKKKRCIFFSDAGSNNNGSTAGVTITEEIDLYLKDPYADENIDPFSFWKKNAATFERLSKFAPKYLSLPASSAPVERVFNWRKIFPSRTNSIVRFKF